jgi:hypothetical protein
MAVQNWSLKILYLQSCNVVTTKYYGMEVDISAYMMQEILTLKKPKGQV